MDESLVSSSNARTLPVLTGDIRNKIDRVWDAFWSGGISNPLEVMEQITYLLFLKRLDELRDPAREPRQPHQGADAAAHVPEGQRPEGDAVRGAALVAVQAADAGGDVRARRRARLPVPARAWAATGRPTPTT